VIACLLTGLSEKGRGSIGFPEEVGQLPEMIVVEQPLELISAGGNKNIKGTSPHGKSKSSNSTFEENIGYIDNSVA
jgi:hypothetical protein